LFLCQRKHAPDILIETRTSGAKPSKSPMEQNHKLSSDAGDPLVDAS